MTKGIKQRTTFSKRNNRKRTSRSGMECTYTAAFSDLLTIPLFKVGAEEEQKLPACVAVDGAE